MPELIVVCGRQNAGKTTWVAHLVSALQERGLRVGTIKHTHHDYAVVGKDTTRHQNAGAERVVLASPNGAAVYEPWREEPDLLELVERFFGEFDLVLAEGYRASPHPKLVVGEDNVDPTTVLASLRPVRGELKPAEVLRAVELIYERVTQPRRAG